VLAKVAEFEQKSSLKEDIFVYASREERAMQEKYIRRRLVRLLRRKFARLLEGRLIAIGEMS